MAKTARQRIERAFHVSFMLPDQAAELLDKYKAEVRREMMTEVLAAVEAVAVPPESGRHWHWFSFAKNRIMLKLQDWPEAESDPRRITK